MGRPRYPLEAPPGMPRLFVAVPLQEPARESVAKLVDHVRAAVDGDEPDARSAVRWVRMDGLHLTLRFLGPTLEERIEDLSAALADLAGGCGAFDVTIGEAGAFPSAARPRTLWLGIQEGIAELQALTNALDDRLETLGWPRDERPFRAHLTLARADGRRAGPATARALVDLAAEFRAGFEAEQVVLFESVTGGGPARYVPRFEAALAG